MPGQRVADQGHARDLRELLVEGLEVELALHALHALGLHLVLRREGVEVEFDEVELLIGHASVHGGRSDQEVVLVDVLQGRILHVVGLGVRAEEHLLRDLDVVYVPDLRVLGRLVDHEAEVDGLERVAQAADRRRGADRLP